MARPKNELKQLLYAHYDLDRDTAQNHLGTCDATFRYLNEKVPAATMAAVTKKLRELQRSDNMPSLCKLPYALQYQFELLDSDIDLGKQYQVVELKKDDRGHNVLHVGFRKYICWDADQHTFYVASDQGGNEYVYSPCVPALPSTNPLTGEIAFVLNALTTILSAGVSIHEIREDAALIWRFLHSLDVKHIHLQENLLLDILERTKTIELGALPVSTMSIDNLCLIRHEDNTIASVEWGSLHACAISRPHKYEYQKAYIVIDTITQDTTPLLRESMCEYVLALNGVVSYFTKFEYQQTPAREGMAVNFNISDVASSFQELQNAMA